MSTAASWVALEDIAATIQEADAYHRDYRDSPRFLDKVGAVIDRPETAELRAAAAPFPRDHRYVVVLRAKVRRTCRQRFMASHPMWDDDTRTDAITALAGSAAAVVRWELQAYKAAAALIAHRDRDRLALQADAHHPEALDPLNLEPAAGLDTAPPPPRETEPHGAALIATAHASQAPPCPATGVCLSAPGGPP